MKVFLLSILGLVVAIAAIVGILVLLNQNRITVLDDQVCAPPCWQGIRPGQTTGIEVISTLESISYVGEIEQFWEDDPRRNAVDSIAWKFIRPSNDFTGYIYLVDNKVAVMSFMTVRSGTLAQALERLGEPELMYTRYTKNATGKWLDVYMLYPRSGYLVKVDLDLPAGPDPNPIQVELGEKSPVTRLVYFDPAQYDYLLRSRLVFPEDKRAVEGNLQPWPGLGMLTFQH